MTFIPSIEESEWRVKSSALECQIAQPVPHFGEGVFVHQAGGASAFFFKPYNPVLQPGKATLKIEAPSWRPNESASELGRVEITDAFIPVEVDQALAGQMLTSLNQGLQPTLLAGSADSSVKIGLSSANFQGAYQEYIACLTQLIPVSYERIARSAIFFKNSKTVLSGSVKEQLDLIARYIKADQRVSKVYVDGHTDDTGPKAINIRISKARAQAVKDYFAKAGVKKQLIVARYHADKYPAMKNESEENRARNRRVTIRLDRD